MAKKNPDVYFAGGYSPRRDLMGTIAYLHELADTDAEHTRFYMYNPDKDAWGHREIDHEIVSVVYQKAKDRVAWFLLNKRGTIVEVSPSGVAETKIPGAGTGPGQYGYLRQIREIAGDLYACGMCRQVYRRIGNAWTSISDEILAPRDSVEFCFESMDGNSNNDIYAVGWQGEIFHYNGTKWSKCDSPTNVDLNAVKYVDHKTIYACGNDGTVVYGSRDTWNVIQEEEMGDDFWGIEFFKGLTYISSLNGIFQLKDKALTLVDTKLKPKPDSYRLHANEELMWSFGNHDLTFFDGKRWKRTVCPDNR